MFFACGVRTRTVSMVTQASGKTLQKSRVTAGNRVNPHHWGRGKYGKENEEESRDLTPSRSSPTLSLRKERVKIIRKDFKPQQACSYSLTLSFLKERVGEERDGVRSPTPSAICRRLRLSEQGKSGDCSRLEVQFRWSSQTCGSGTGTGEWRRRPDHQRVVPLVYETKRDFTCPRRCFLPRRHRLNRFFEYHAQQKCVTSCHG